MPYDNISPSAKYVLSYGMPHYSFGIFDFTQYSWESPSKYSVRALEIVRNRGENTPYGVLKYSVRSILENTEYFEGGPEYSVFRPKNTKAPF